MVQVLGILFLLLCFGIVVYNTYKSVYAWFDHYGWEKNSKPNKNAKIQNMTSTVVRYGSSSTKSKLKTTIIFSDGFYFITHKTEYERVDFIVYKLYLSEELKKKIIDSAIEKHKLAVDKFISQK